MNAMLNNKMSAVVSKYRDDFFIFVGSNCKLSKTQINKRHTKKIFLVNIELKPNWTLPKRAKFF